MGSIFMKKMDNNSIKQKFLNFGAMFEECHSLKC